MVPTSGGPRDRYATVPVVVASDVGADSARSDDCRPAVGILHPDPRSVGHGRAAFRTGLDHGAPDVPVAIPTDQSPGGTTSGAGWSAGIGDATSEAIASLCSARLSRPG